MAGCLWMSGRLPEPGVAAVGLPGLGAAAGASLRQWAMGRVRMYSAGPVRLAAMQRRVVGLQVARMVLRSWLLR